MIGWESLFEEAEPADGASEEEIQRFVANVFSPLTDAEIDLINASQRNPFPDSNPRHATYEPFDPSKWRFPTTPLPESYLDLIRWSNGGEFGNGDREFGFFGTNVREFLVGYHVPEYMPLAIPFAFDGGGSFYLFDMRKPAQNGEYPIVFAGSGALGWEQDDYVKVANSLLEACAGTVHPFDL